ncbi:nucleoside-diphosphate-sugar epimerase [Microdochium trichocladiopsis]|uniref:Nucleoside-diphosphate-sugar epimerase n=1 Tax=Microdochium trichocladiopsis TaxID=1682393 RepID=A0A9P8Y3Z2_9PEZI|nr:nucleoside-diphosphate-sugar epimerase [Microdochium trichocladiopsis]KAH7028094.1 nucleoside-diphosphate-sugar epimerase [Microdochium trichocladiopsis]
MHRSARHVAAPASSSKPRPPGSLKILITGAAGFVGQIVAEALLNDEQGRYEVLLADIIEPPLPKGVKWPDKAMLVQADLLKQADSVVESDLDVAFVFHGIMSSGAEADFELGMSVNFDSTRALLDTLRRTAPGVKVIYTSTQAVYGGVDTIPLPVTEAVRATPQTSYGCEKMMCEYLINEYTRRGFINGFIFRLPTVSVRAGKPTAAASSFLSGIIREPMQGQECVIPLTDRGWSHWLTSPRVLLRNLLHALDLERDALPDYDRAVNLPGLGVTVQDMMDSLARVGGEDKLRLLREEDDPAIRPILDSWPAHFDNTKALGLGFERDTSFDDIVRDFKDGLEKQKSSSSG